MSLGTMGEVCHLVPDASLPSCGSSRIHLLVQQIIHKKRRHPSLFDRLASSWSSNLATMWHVETGTAAGLWTFLVRRLASDPVAALTPCCPLPGSIFLRATEHKHLSFGVKCSSISLPSLPCSRLPCEAEKSALELWVGVRGLWRRSLAGVLPHTHVQTVAGVFPLLLALLFFERDHFRSPATNIFLDWISFFLQETTQKKVEPRIFCLFVDTTTHHCFVLSDDHQRNK